MLVYLPQRDPDVGSFAQGPVAFVVEMGILEFYQLPSQRVLDVGSFPQGDQLLLLKSGSWSFITFFLIGGLDCG